jgi:sulfite exporter TauE/SafE
MLASLVKGVTGLKMSLILWVLYTLLGLLLATVGWALWQLRGRQAESGLVATDGSLLLWLSILGTIALGTFLTYLLAGLGS